jgi:hypothetical protein
MRVRTLKVAAVSSGGRGPSDYLLSKIDSRKRPRNPEPKVLLGDPDYFEYLVSRSRAEHPYTSYILSYKNERRILSRADRASIHADFLKMARGGLAEERIYVLIVDHGDHEHGAIYRHVIDPTWKRFQPYYDVADKHRFSNFQWLVNRRYGLSAPEDPANHQLVSLAGKHFDDGAVEFLVRLRKWVADEWKRAGLKTHDAFRQLLADHGWKATVKSYELEKARLAGEEEDFSPKEQRVWLEVENRAEMILLKGPLCSPGFRRADYEYQEAEEVQKYQMFLDNRFRLWDVFIQAERQRRKRNEKLYRGLCEPETPDACLGFDDLHPSRHPSLDID